MPKQTRTAKSREPKASSSTPRAKLVPDPLFEDLGTDPAQLEGTTMLCGFLGRSTRAGYWRLYPTPDLSEYVEFREEDAVHSYNGSHKTLPAGGTMVWLRSDAKVQHTRSTTVDAQAAFLQGQITGRYLTGAGAADLLNHQLNHSMSALVSWISGRLGFSFSNCDTCRRNSDIANTCANC